MIPRLLRSTRKPEARQKQLTGKSRQDSWDGVSRELFEAMRAIRRGLALERGVPPFVVFSDTSLRDMARRQPTTLTEFLEVNGVGEKKRDEYGEIFLDLIAQYNADLVDGSDSDPFSWDSTQA